MKSCCAVGCTKRSVNGCGVSFCHFPRQKKSFDSSHKSQKLAASEYSWLCSSHFISGSKSDDPLSPDYVPSQFAHLASPAK